MNIDIYSYSDIGSRVLNEDSYGVKKGGGKYIAVLCDGLGGHDRGEIASDYAVRNIIEGINQIKTVNAEQIYSVIQKVNDGLIQQQVENPEYSGMRTTSVGCVTVGNKLYYFNTGDSRFYYFSNGAMTIMTKDHSVSQMSVEMGDMSFDDIRFDVNRNKLLKVMGDNTGSEIATVYKPIQLKRGDAFLLCSDGFWEYILEEEMEIDLSKSETSKDWIEYMLVRLLLRVSGNNDNFTVVGGIVK